MLVGNRPVVILLDENVPRIIAQWLKGLRSAWTIYHVSDVGLEGKDDKDIYDWAQVHQSIIITFDEDFADRRSFPVENHYGLIRLRVWPTTIEETENALDRLIEEVSDEELFGSLIIIDRRRIRIRPQRR